MSIGGVNNIEKEPLRRASKGELDDVEGGGGGTDYRGIAPIVVSGDAISITMDDAPESGSGNAVKSSGVKAAVDGCVQKTSDNLQTVDSLMYVKKGSNDYLRTWGGTSPSLELGSASVPVAVPDTGTGMRGQAAVNQNRLMEEIAAIPKDDFPTSGSEDLVKSGGVYYACNNLQQGITQNTNAIVSLQNTKQDTITVSAPIVKSGSGLSLSMDQAPVQNSGKPVTSGGLKTQFDAVAQDMVTLSNAINTTDGKFAGTKIIGYWHGKQAQGGVTKWSGNLNVQAYGSSNPGLYLLTGFNVNYQKRGIFMQVYHGDMLLVKPAKTESATQCQFTVNSPDGSAYGSEIWLDILMVQFP